MIIGITGFSGSGKTTFAEKLLDISDNISLISQDNYYKTMSGNIDPLSYDFDSLEAIDLNLILDHIDQINTGKKILEIPKYDFKTHSRRGFEIFNIKKVTLIEGHLIFTDSRIIDKVDILIFIDTDLDTSLGRRIIRDIKERGRDLDEVIIRYELFVKKVHMELEKLKSKSTIIIPNNTSFDNALEIVSSYLKECLQNES